MFYFNNLVEELYTAEDTSVKTVLYTYDLERKIRNYYHVHLLR